MFCANCGKEITNESKFCKYCGAQVNTKAQNPVVKATLNSDKQEKKIQREKAKQERRDKVSAHVKRAKKIVKTAFCVIVIMAVFLVGGSLFCDGGQYVLANEIDKYGISDFIQQKDNVIDDYKDYNFFDIVHKVKSVVDLSKMEKETKKADQKIEEQKKLFDEMNVGKDVYDLDEDSYAEYTEALETWSDAIADRDYDKSVNAASAAQNNLEQLVKDNKAYVQEKLDLYNTVAWSDAEADEKKSYDENEKKVNALLKDGKYNDIKTLFTEMDNIAYRYITPEESLDVEVQQIDASRFPNVKLYVQMEDRQGNVPSDLNTNFFYVKQKDAKESYIRQKVVQVTQLDEFESLNVNMVADVSGSMAGSPLDEAKQMMNDFIDSVQFNVGDRMELITFNESTNVEEKFTGNATALKSRVDGLNADGGTSVYDALYEAVNRTAPQSGAKCVISFTDGEDNSSNYTPEQVIQIAKKYSIPIFIIGVGSVDENELCNIANSTGGAYYPIEDITSIKEIYNQIYKQEKELYMIRYEDKTGDSVKDTAHLRIGYNSNTYGGEENYTYTPENLINAEDSMDKEVDGYVRVYDGKIFHTYPIL